MTALLDHLRQQASAQVARLGVARHALVTAVDPVNHACKVEIQPEGIESGWIADPGLASGSLRISSPCEIGTQVLVVPAEGDPEHPVIVGRLFDAVQTPAVSPATQQPAQPGEFLSMTGLAGAPGSNQQAGQVQTYIHQTPTQIILGVGSNVLTLDEQGLHLSVGGYATTLSASMLSIGRPVEVNGDVTAEAISLQEHVHTAVQPGSGVSGGPQG